MSQTAADVAAQIQNMRQLDSVVTALRGIAAARTQQSRALLAGTEAYADVVSGAIGEALALLPPLEPARPARSAGQRGLILFCAERGFAGAFSERVLAAAGAEAQTTVNFLIGTRGSLIATERGIPLAWTDAMPANVAGIPALANRITEALYERVAAGLYDIDVLFPRAVTPEQIDVERVSLLPVEFGRFARTASQPPLTTLAPPALLEHLAEEYVFAVLCSAATHAYAAENEARMTAMAAARDNVEKRLEGLRERERRLRQEAITDEVVELAAGTMALESARRS